MSSNCQNVSSELAEKEVDELHAELLREVKSTKKNLEAIQELQESTFEKRKHRIQQLGHEKTDKNNVEKFVTKYPFFKVHEYVVSIVYCMLRCPHPFLRVGLKDVHLFVMVLSDEPKTCLWRQILDAYLFQSPCENSYVILR